jgi:hypothetical protein
MKSLNLFAVALIWAPLISLAGTEGGGGGDYEKLKFRIVANKVLTLVQKNISQFPEVSFVKLRDAVGNTKIEFVNAMPTASDGKHDNVNNPEKMLIEMQRHKWRAAFGKPSVQASMVLHELLGIMKVNDQNFKISSRIAALLTEQPKAFFRFSCAAWNCGEWYIGEGDTRGEAWSEVIDLSASCRSRNDWGADRLFTKQGQFKCSGYQCDDMEREMSATMTNACNPNF